MALLRIGIFAVNKNHQHFNPPAHHGMPAIVGISTKISSLLDKTSEITYLLGAKLIFYIPLTLLWGLSYELSALNSKRQFGFGGETASTGIKKLELHTERPVSS